MADGRKMLRCAVYTRKSSEHGLEQDFRGAAHCSQRGEVAGAKRPPNGRLLFVRTKHVANIGSYGENAQRFVCSQSFTDPRDVLPQDVPLWLSKCFVPEY